MRTVFTVWCQGGPSDDFRYRTVVEPPDEIWVLPRRKGRTMRVMGPWPGATLYRRQPSVEQIDNELIYYPTERHAT